MLQKIELSVPAMSCDNCVNNIRSTLSVIAGIADVSPDLNAKRVSLCFDESKVTERQIATALAKLGFSCARA